MNIVQQFKYNNSNEKIVWKSTNQKQELPVAPCLLTDWDEMCNLYSRPSIDASYQVSFHLAKWLQKRRFSETRITCGGNICKTNRDDMNNLHR